MIEIGPEVYVTTMTTSFSGLYDYFEDALTDRKSIKLKSYPVEDVTDWCAKILVDVERLESSGSFNTEQLG